jgi:phosphoribosyl 1,2-cyclic phosphodiesterase
MSVKFCVLGSGSHGNAVLLMTPQLHVLIDAGFPPDELGARMEGTGATWSSLHAIILTHTHADHLCKKCLVFCAEHEIHFICHERHAAHLAGGRYFKRLLGRGLLQTYDGTSFQLQATGGRNAAFASFVRGAEPACEAALDLMRFHPIPVPHDAPPTFGFRIEARGPEIEGPPRGSRAEPTLFAEPKDAAAIDAWVRLGYLVDIGRCADEIMKSVHDVDLLALEFNHDEHLERTSGRHPRLIQRVMGGDGHLSNRQAAEVFRKIVETGPHGGPDVLVQMHLSEDCNRADLAYQAAQEILLLTGARTRIFSSRQNQRGTIHAVGRRKSEVANGLGIADSAAGGS